MNLDRQILQQLRSVSEFSQDMKDARFDQVKSVDWGGAIPALPANAGYKLRGTVTLDDGANSTGILTSQRECPSFSRIPFDL